MGAVDQAGFDLRIDRPVIASITRPRMRADPEGMGGSARPSGPITMVGGGVIGVALTSGALWAANDGKTSSAPSHAAS